MNNLVKLNLFGELSEFLGNDSWELDVKSVAEAIRALNTLTKNKFSDFFIKNNKLNAKYRILINGEDFCCPEQNISEKNWHVINNSELVMKKENLKTIDIVPFIESAGTHGLGIITTILGALILIVGIILVFTPAGVPLIVAGLGLLGAGVVSLLSKPPVFNYGQQLSNASAQSYLFSGPQNTVGEGGPIPVGYGTLAVGSNVVSAGYKITEFQSN